MFELVRREIARAGYEGMLGAGVVITGGTSLLEGMPDAAEQVLNLPARRGTPTGIGGLRDIVEQSHACDRRRTAAACATACRRNWTQPVCAAERPWAKMFGSNEVLDVRVSFNHRGGAWPPRAINKEVSLMFSFQEDVCRPSASK